MTTRKQLLITIWLALYVGKSLRKLRRFVPGSKGEAGWSKELSLSIIAIYKLFIPNYLFRDLRKHPQRRRQQRREANLRVQSVGWWTNFPSIVINTQPTETSPTIAYNYTQLIKIYIKSLSTKNITQQSREMKIKSYQQDAIENSNFLHQDIGSAHLSD